MGGDLLRLSKFDGWNLKTLVFQRNLLFPRVPFSGELCLNFGRKYVSVPNRDIQVTTAVTPVRPDDFERIGLLGVHVPMLRCRRTCSVVTFLLIR